MNSDFQDNNTLTIKSKNKNKQKTVGTTHDNIFLLGCLSLIYKMSYLQNENDMYLARSGGETNAMKVDP